VIPFCRISKVSEFGLVSAWNKTQFCLYSLKQSWDAPQGHDESGPQARLSTARCRAPLPCRPIKRNNVFLWEVLLSTSWQILIKNCFAGIFSASSSERVYNNCMLAKTAESAE